MPAIVGEWESVLSYWRAAALQEVVKPGVALLAADPGELVEVGLGGHTIVAHGSDAIAALVLRRRWAAAVRATRSGPRWAAACVSALDVSSSSRLMPPTHGRAMMASTLHS